MNHKSGDSRNQIKMVCLEELVAEDSSARFIDTFVEKSDMSYFVNAETKGTGRPPYSPKDMMKLYLYGLENNILSSRKLERVCKDSVSVMWLMNGLAPESKTICNFRKDNKENIVTFFKTFCLTLKNCDLIDGKVMAIDGTKIRANNGKKNNFSRKKLKERIAEIDSKIAEYMEDLDKQDKVDRLKARKEQYEKLEEQLIKEEINEVSLIDPDARMMQNASNAYEVSYNVQSVVDSKHKLIAGMAVTNKAADQGQLAEVMPTVKEELELEEVTVLADKGYYKTEDFHVCEENKITPIVCVPKKGKKETYGVESFKYDQEKDEIVCPANKKLYPGKTDKQGFKGYQNNRACKNCPQKEQCTKGNRRVIKRHISRASAERNDIRYKENINLYLTRQALVEHPFGTIKRTMHIRQFLTRGKGKVSAEIALIFTSYNLKRLRVIHKNAPEKDDFWGKFLHFLLKILKNSLKPKNKRFSTLPH